MATDRGGEPLRMGTATGRWAVTATVAGSAVAMVAGTVVNVALPDIAAGIGADTAGVQWILNSYMLALASLILFGGALGDRFGRRRVYVIGTMLFGVASLAAAAAPSLGLLLTARAAMGVGAALLTPGSLAMLEASFVQEDRAAAIGAWSGLGGVAAAVGPMIGGALLDVTDWRALFLLPVPVCGLAIWLSLRHLPESRDPGATGARLDWAGAATGALGLGAVSFGLVGLGRGPTGSAIASLMIGLLLLLAFVVVERHVDTPLVPPSIFGNRTFTVANLLTFVVYAALGGVFFLLVVFLRQVLGFSGTQAGAATLPITLMMLTLSSRSGRLASRIGPRLPLTVGSVLLATGMAVYSTLDARSTYLTGVLPGMLLFGAGLVALVAPVTAAVLAAAESDKAGLASGVNNAVARTAGLLAVAVLPPAAGLGPDAFTDPAVFADGFAVAMSITAVLTLCAAPLAWFGLPRDLQPVAAHSPTHPHCDLEAPPVTIAHE